MIIYHGAKVPNMILVKSYHQSLQGYTSLEGVLKLEGPIGRLYVTWAQQDGGGQTASGWATIMKDWLFTSHHSAVGSFLSRGY